MVLNTYSPVEVFAHLILWKWQKVIDRDSTSCSPTPIGCNVRLEKPKHGSLEPRVSVPDVVRSLFPFRILSRSFCCFSPKLGGKSGTESLGSRLVFPSHTSTRSRMKDYSLGIPLKISPLETYTRHNCSCAVISYAACYY